MPITVICLLTLPLLRRRLAASGQLGVTSKTTGSFFLKNLRKLTIFDACRQKKPPGGFFLGWEAPNLRRLT